MISVALYTPYWENMGGGEKYLCAMAEALAADGRYDVTLLSDSRPLDQQAMESYFAVSLSGVHMYNGSPRLVADALERTRIAVVTNNYRSLGLPGTRTVYVLQVPYPDITAGSIVRKVARGEIRDGIKDILRRGLLATCRKASAVLVYSEFVRSSLRQHHRLSSTVLHPPIDDFSGHYQKERAILSVGRIFRGEYNDKRYDVLIEAFRILCGRQERPGLQYWIAGSCADDPRSQAWLAELRERSRGFPIRFYVNASYATLAELYGRASLLWHAAGYGIDEHRHPERTEHFGMTPLEAMSARCVPLAVNAGGTRDTVEQGVSGYLWSTPAELLGHTERLLDNSGLLEAFRRGARSRFTGFSRHVFANALISRFQELGMQSE